MKRFNFLCTLVCALLSLFGSTAYADTGNLIKDQVTVTITDGKYLSELIDEAVAPRITNLKIVGAIDGTDILYLRELLGVGRKPFVEKENIKSNLQILDLSDAHIREGGMTYCEGNLSGRVYNIYTHNDEIGEYMFASCHSLKKITLPYSITSIELAAFYECSELEEIIKFDNITKIRSGAFQNCSKLKEFKLPKLQELESSTFEGCKSLISLEIPEGITTLPKAFAQGCSSLKNVVLPKTLKTIENRALCKCESLTSLEIPEGITDLPSYFVAGCSSLKNVVLPKSLNYVGWGAFQECSSLERIDLPNTLENIQTNAFASCTSLKYFRLPEGIKNLGDGIIANTSLEELHIPFFPSIMGNHVFADCHIMHLYSYREKPYRLNEYRFQNLNYSTCTLHVPKGSREAYAEAYYWRDFGTIVEMNEGEGGGGDDTPKTAFAVFDPSNGVLTFKYEASKPDGAYSLNEGRTIPMWVTKHDVAIQKVIFDDSFAKARPVTCMCWFFGCTNLKNIEGINNLNTTEVTDMGAMFRNCSSLTDLDVSGFDTRKVTTMGTMFSGCSKLSTLDVSGFDTKNVTDMYCMFNKCSGLTTLNVSGFDTKNVTNMREMFSGCSKLATIYVSDKFVTTNVTEGKSMFNMCKALEGAVSYNGQQNDMAMANYHNGYFKTYYKIGNEIFPLCGETLSVDNLALTDSKDFVIYTPFETNAVSYSSELNEGATWETLCLPFEVSLANKNFRAFTLLSVKSDVVELQEITDCITAGTPVIIKMNEGATSINITENDKMIVRERQDSMLVDNCKLVGHYTHKTFGNDDDLCFVINGDKLVKATKMSAYTRSMDYSSNGFRAYMKVCTNTGTPADEYKIDIKGSTAIELIKNTAEGKPEYYDLEGHRLSNLKKGVNIVKRGNKTMKVIIR
ncbi:leucine-rich repeat protein [Prevotella sp.]|uniref:leucine-rich repeat protein n=1 Tax=Prevotella sp. TaxID=59823 RepID=UPI00345C6B3A